MESAVPRSTDADLRAVPLVVMTAVLWAYIVSIYVYRIWYVAAMVAVLLVASLAVARTIRTAGLVRALAPVLAYYAVLLAGASWALYPRDTLRWVAIDSIEIAVFALAFLAGRNATPGAITAALLTLTIPGVAITAIMYARDPAATRIGQYAISLLAVVTPFAYWRIVHARPRWPAILALAAGFAVLLFGRSRTQLATACLLTAIAALVFRRNVRASLREAVAGAVVAAATAAALLLVPATRTPVVTMFVRVTGIPVSWGDLHVAAEKKNDERAALTALSLDILPHQMPLGIGYMNFGRYFRGVEGYDSSLHNVYMTWLLEGGLPCVAAVLLLAWLHIRGLRAYIGGALDPAQRAYGQACAIGSVGILTIGAFHQVHQSPVLWMLLGLGAACGAEALPRRRPVGSAEGEGSARFAALMEGWRQSNPPFAPALCEPLMTAGLRHLAWCERGGVIADIGCGNGFMLPVFRAGGYRSFGVDADAEAVAGAGGPVVAAEGEQLPFRSGVVDGLFVFSAFQYMDRVRALVECHRVLRPDGRLVVVENLQGNPVARLSRLVRRMRGIRYPHRMEPRQHLRWEDRSVYEAWFSDVTYEVHHVVTPLFLWSGALAAGAPRSPANRAVLATLRVLQQLERRLLAAGLFRRWGWHLVLSGRKGSPWPP